MFASAEYEGKDSSDDLCVGGEGELKANKWKSTTWYGKLIHLYLLCFSCRICSSAGKLWLAAWHVPSRLKRTSKDTEPWRIESPGHELHSYPHKDKPHVSAPFENRQKREALKYYETLRARAIKCLLILMLLQSEIIFCSIMDGGMEKWVLKPGL